MGDTLNTTFHYDTLPTPKILTSIPHKNSIELLWSNISGATAYDLYIYRNNDFVRVNRNPITDGTFYTVSNLGIDSTYKFSVKGYDKYMNSSDLSSLYYESTNPTPYNKWPLNNSDISLSSVIPADFFSDGNIEIFESFKSGKLLMTYLNGDTVAGWPQYIEGEIWGTPAVADVDNDGKLDIVVAPWSSSDKIYIFNADGTVTRYVRGDPTNKGLYGVAGSPVIRDINGDGSKEIIVGATNGDIYIWEPNGTGFFRSDGLFAERKGDNWDLNVVSAQDPDEDSIYTIYALSRTGVFYGFSTTQHDSDSLAIPITGTPDTLLGGTYYQPTVGEIGPHQGKDIALVAGSALYLFNDSLTIYPNFPIPLKANVFVSQPILYDVDSDGYKDIILSVGDSVFCYNYQGYLLDNYPYKFGTAMQSSPIAGVLNDTPYVFIGTGDLTISAFSIYGKKMRGFPIETEDNFYCAPSIGDSVLAASDYSSNTYLWKIPLKPSLWPSIYHDFQHTGDAEFPISDGIGIKHTVLLSNKINTNIKISYYKNIFSINGLPKKENFSIKIFDLSGRIVNYKRISYDKLKLLCHKNGVYFIKIDSDKIKYAGKFLFLK
ncbi:MAG: T9SS type A sorting domain-containing protein [Proteobacteria bacterium]|nr:T9SS type A sorting domain-containing protein [Pseudomonadota bacterium]